MTISSKRTIRILAFSLLALLAAVGVLFWTNYRFALQNPGGNDFLPRWNATRSYIFQGQSPYSAETKIETQNLIYGRLARADENQGLFVDPFYATLVYSPFALVGDYVLARALWMTLLQAGVVGLAFLAMRLAGFHPKTWFLPAYLLFSILWYHGLRPLVHGDPVVFVALLIAAALIAIWENRDIPAGILLGWSTILPHLVILPIFFVFLWAISRRRWAIIGWTIGAVVLLILLGMTFIPNWPLQYIWQALSYRGYDSALSFGEVFQIWWPGVGVQLKWGLTLILAGLLILEWWSAWGKEFPHFLWAFCLTLTVSQWLGVATDPGNFVLLFLPLVLIFSVWRERWRRGGDWVILIVLLILFVGVWSLFLETVSRGDQPLQHPVMFLPVPIFTLVGLYWVRWWVVRPIRHILGIPPNG